MKLVAFGLVSLAETNDEGLKWFPHLKGGIQRWCALLGICERTILAPFPELSVYWRKRKGAPANPRTLGDHLRLVRIDRRMTNVQEARLLGVTYQTVEKLEHNRVPISEKMRATIVAFIGCDFLSIGTQNSR